MKNYEYDKRWSISIFMWRNDTRNQYGKEARKLTENSGGAVQVLLAENLIWLCRGKRDLKWRFFNYLNIDDHNMSQSLSRIGFISGWNVPNLCVFQ